MASSSPSSSPPNLRDPLHFPSMSMLPGEYSIDPTYYTLQSSTARPKIHWCSLAEIVQEVGLVRPMYNVKDIDDEEWLVAFHPEDRSRLEPMAAKCKVGYTMCVMYANQHRFADGQHGIRIEFESALKVLPRSLDQVLQISDRVQADKKMCVVCEKETVSRCPLCHTKYCSKACQMVDWKNRGHKLDCSIIQQLHRWGTFDWDRFDHFRSE